MEQNQQAAWYQAMIKIEELQQRVAQLEQENQNLKLNIVAISPLYPEEQRRAAMEQINANMAREAERESIRAAFR